MIHARFGSPRTMRGAIAAFLLAVSAAAGAQTAPFDGRDRFVFPLNGLSPADEAFVRYGDNCGRPHPDPQRAPDVRRDGAETVVDIYLVDQRPIEVCPAVVAPDIEFPVSIGRFAKGVHSVLRRLHVRPVDGTSYTLAHEGRDLLEVRDTPNPAISGSWYDPAQPGVGLVLGLLPPGDGEFDPLATVFVATVDTQGQAVWFTGAGRFADGVLEIPVGRGGMTPAMASGTLTFRYTGCGTATVALTAPGLAFPDGTVALQQLTRINQVPGCDPAE